MTSSPPRRLGEILLDLGIVSQQQLNTAVDFQITSESSAGRAAVAARRSLAAPRRTYRLGEALVALGICTETDIARALAVQQGRPFVDLEAEPPSPGVTRLLRHEVAREYIAVPLKLEGERLTVVSAEAGKPGLAEVLERETGLPVDLAVASEPQVRAVLDRLSATGGVPSDDGKRSGEELLHRLLSQALEWRARDLFLEPMPSSVDVRFRVRGQVVQVDPMEPDEYERLLAHLKRLCEQEQSYDAGRRQGFFPVRMGGNRLEVQFASSVDRLGERAVLHLIPE